MWNAGGMINPSQPPPPPAHGGGASGGVKHDIFVGNLSFGTTEEQLHQAFSEVGRVVNVRLVNDLDTGKPRGFAFVEFDDPQAALSAIRNMNDYELNGRRIRVNFSNSSHLEQLANELGMDLSQPNSQSKQQKETTAPAAAGTTAVAEALKNMSKGEMYDVVAKLKEIADRDPDEARRIISGHPQLPEALLFLMSKLDMVKTPLPDMSMMGGPMATPQPTVLPTVPTAQRVADPRAAMRPPADPRQRGAAPPPPPPPPPMDPRQRQPPGLDPALVQQVMSLTPQQIAQLPPDKQQSILQLRQQITGGR